MANCTISTKGYYKSWIGSGKIWFQRGLFSNDIFMPKCRYLYIYPPPPAVRGSSESPSKEWLDEPVVDVMNPGITLGEQGFIHFL